MPNSAASSIRAAPRPMPAGRWHRPSSVISPKWWKLAEEKAEEKPAKVEAGQPPLTIEQVRAINDMMQAGRSAEEIMTVMDRPIPSRGGDQATPAGRNRAAKLYRLSQRCHHRRRGDLMAVGAGVGVWTTSGTVGWLDRIRAAFLRTTRRRRAAAHGQPGVGGVSSGFGGAGSGGQSRLFTVPSVMLRFSGRTWPPT